MYVLVVLVNLCFCLGLTLQVFFSRAKKEGVKPFKAPRRASAASVNEALRTKLRGASKTVQALRGHTRRLEHEKKSLLYKLDEDRRLREKLQAKLEEERLLRNNLLSRLKALTAENAQLSSERDSCKAMLDVLSESAGAVEKLAAELKSAGSPAESKTSDKDAGKALAASKLRAALQPQDIPQLARAPSSGMLSSCSAGSVVSTASTSSLLMRSCDSASSQHNSSGNSVLTEDFFESKMRHSELLGPFIGDSDDDSLASLTS